MKLRPYLLTAGILAAAGLTAGLVLKARRPAALPAGVTVHAGPLDVVALAAEPRQVEAGGTVQLAADIRRSVTAKSSLEITWRATGGRIEGHGATATWRAPAAPGRFDVAVLVKDGEARAARGASLLVHLPSARGGLRPAPRLTEEQDQALKEERQRHTVERVRELREKISGKQYGSPAEHLTFLGELGDALVSLGDPAGALEAYYLAITSQPLTSPATRRYRRGYGEAALLLGREDEALQAFLDAGGTNTGATYYQAGDLLERRGRLDEALTAYRQAAEADPWSTSDASYRAALIQLERGDQTAAFEMVMNASAAVGAELVRERLRTDRTLAPLLTALEQSGKLAELPQARGVDRKIPGAEDDFVPGTPAVEIIPADQ